MGFVDDIRDAYELAKKVKDSINDADAKLALSDVMMTLADARVEAAKLQEKLSAKDAELARLREIVKEESDLVFTDRWYVDEQDRPYCPSCYQNPASPNPLVLLSSGTRTNDYDCPVCGWRFRGRGEGATFGRGPGR